MSRFAIGWNLLVTPIEEEEPSSPGGIVFPETSTHARKSLARATVLHAGAKAEDELKITEGDVIHYPRGLATMVDKEEGTAVVKAGDVLVVDR